MSQHNIAIEGVPGSASNTRCETGGLSLCEGIGVWRSRKRSVARERRGDTLKDSSGKTTGIQAHPRGLRLWTANPKPTFAELQCHRLLLPKSMHSVRGMPS